MLQRVGEVLEHLCIAAEANEPTMRDLLQRARADAGAPLREWAPTACTSSDTRSRSSV